MKIALINGSPKGNKSTTNVLLNMIRKGLDGAEIIEATVVKDAMQAEKMAEIAGCDALLLAFPLYIDSIPSHDIGWMKEFDAYLKANAGGSVKRVFAVSNCGFAESFHNLTALEVVKNWSARIGANFAGAAAVGKGGMILSVSASAGEKGPMKPLSIDMQKFATKIMDENYADGEIMQTSPGFPNFLYKSVSHKLWKSMAKENGISVKDIEATSWDR